MAKLMGLDGKLLSELYQEGIIAIRSAFWKPSEPRYDVVHDRLKKAGVSLPMLNLRLYCHGIPPNLGRFPGLFESQAFVVETVHNLLDEYQGNRELSREEASKRLTRDIAREVANLIAYSSSTFELYTLANNSQNP